MQFILVRDAVDRLPDPKAQRLERISEGIGNSSLVTLKVNINSGTIRYVDSEDGSLLLEVNNTLNL